jgi:glycosyltransferase involved in cell wall biosynthesis
LRLSDSVASSPHLSVVVPCYNEAENLPALASSFRTAFQDRSSVEVILVDNGSTDETARILEEECSRADSGFLKVIFLETNLGYGGGIKAGLLAAEGEIVAWTHGDLQADPADVLRAYDFFQCSGQPDRLWLKGSRKGRGTVETAMTLGLSLLCSALLGQWLLDFNAQPKMFHRGFLSRLSTAPDDFSFDLYALYTARRCQLNLLRFPVVFTQRQGGVAKGGGAGWKTRLKLCVRTVRYVLRLKRTLMSERANLSA